MLRPIAIRNAAAIALACCLALGGTAHYRGWSTCIVDPSESAPSESYSSQNDPSENDSKPRQPARHHAATAPATRCSRVRTTHLFSAPDLGFKFAGSESAAPQISALLANRRLPVQRSRAVTPRSGRSPPLAASV
jgi:hypothetical protein